MTRDVRGMAVLLTGASRGIGRALAVRLAGRGARLLLVARNREVIDGLANELRVKGAEAHAYAADLTDPDQRAALVEFAARTLGGLDALVNNAGLASFGEFETSTEDVLRQIMEINFFAPVELIRLCLPHLAESRRRPVVVNVGSVIGRCGIPSFPEHSASKFALSGMSEALRGEFVRFGVDVVLVLPGMVRLDDEDAHMLRNEGKIKLDRTTRGLSVERVARGIVRAMERGWMETVVGWTALQVHRGRRVMPRVVDWVLRRKVRKFAERSAAGRGV